MADVKQDAKQITEPSAVSDANKDIGSSPVSPGAKDSVSPTDTMTYYGRTQVSGQVKNAESEQELDSEGKDDERLDKHPVYGKRFKKILDRNKEYEEKNKGYEQELQTLRDEYDSLIAEIETSKQNQSGQTQSPAVADQQIQLTPAMTRYAQKLMSIHGLDEQTAIDIAMSTQDLVQEVADSSTMPIKEHLAKGEQERVTKNTIENLNKFISLTPDFKEYDKEIADMYDKFDKNTKVVISTEPSLPTILYKAAKYDRLLLNSTTDNIQSKPAGKDSDDTESTLKDKIFKNPDEWAKYREQLKQAGVIR